MNLFSHVEKKVFTVQQIKYNIIFFLKVAKTNSILIFFPHLVHHWKKKRDFTCFHTENIFFSSWKKKQFSLMKKIFFLKLDPQEEKKNPAKLIISFLWNSSSIPYIFFFPSQIFFFFHTAQTKKKKGCWKKEEFLSVNHHP